MHMRRSLLGDAIDAHGFPYLHEVKGHSSCVNALAFSKGSGQWMASGGDDLGILIRDLFDYNDDRHNGPETSCYRTRARLLGHHSNVFSLSWSVGNKYLFSGANDCLFLAYDLNYGDTPIRQVQPQIERHRPTITFGLHESSIREVSAHPTNPDLALSCSDGGDLYLLDMRLPGQVAQYGYFPVQVESAQWNPNPSDGNRFAVASSIEPGSCVAYVSLLTHSASLMFVPSSTGPTWLLAAPTRSYAMPHNFDAKRGIESPLGTQKQQVLSLILQVDSLPSST